MLTVIARRRRRAISDINVVPYIDVMLVLLVIFMVVAPMVNPGVVNLPSVGAAAVQQQPPLLITIYADRSLVAKVHSVSENFERKLTQQALTELIQQRQQTVPDEPVVIAADKTVSYDTVMQTMAQLKQLGVKRVGLLVKSE